MVAVRAAHLGEPLVQITALKIFADDPRNNGAEKTLRFGGAIVVAPLELVKIIRQNLPEQCLFRRPWPVNSKAGCKLHYPPVVDFTTSLNNYYFFISYSTALVLFTRLVKINSNLAQRTRFEI